MERGGGGEANFSVRLQIKHGLTEVSFSLFPPLFYLFHFYLGAKVKCLLNIISNDSLTYYFNQNCNRKIFSLHC